MKNKNELEPVEVFTGIVWEAEMVKNLLENEGIQAFLSNEIIGTLVPWYTNPGAGSVNVVVAAKDLEQALKVVEAYRKDL